MDANFTLYICDTSNNRIQKWPQGASSATTVTGGTSGGTGATQLSLPLGLSFDNNGYLYVADSGNHRVQKFTPGSSSGVTVAGVVGSSGSSNSLLNKPTNVIVDNSGNSYVTDYINNRVMKFPSTSASGSNGTNTFGGSLGNTVYGIAFQDTSQKNVFVSLDTTPAVQWRTLGLSVTNATVGSSTSYTAPKGLAIDGYGNVYVVDSSSNQVVMFCVNSWIRRVLIQGSAISPALTLSGGIALDSNMNLYVTSASPDGVYKFSYW